MKDLEYLQRQSEKELSILAKDSDANYPFLNNIFHKQLFTLLENSWMVWIALVDTTEITRIWREK